MHGLQSRSYIDRNVLLGVDTGVSIAFAYSIPVLAATVSFVTYTSTHKDFNVAIIFSSFSLFQVCAHS